MTERSHKKGEIYQKDVKHWLAQCPILGFDAELFGDAYDATKKACTIGGIVFDFSLKLGRGDFTRHILYGECKYRNERQGNVNQNFANFLKRVHDALRGAEVDEADSALFFFLSNIPPDDWRGYQRDRRRYCKHRIAWGSASPPEEQVLGWIAQKVHVLILGAEIIART